MARYTGPKTKIARKFGEAIFGDDRTSKKEITLLGNTVITVVEEKNLNTLFN
jgi:hypothetical protein